VLARPPTYGSIQGKPVEENVKKLTEPLPSERSRDEGRPALELLVEAPNEQLDEFVARLKDYQPSEETCDAMMKLIKLPPLSQFVMLREIYRGHCAPGAARRRLSL
jgi:hypothetical protein